MLREMGGSEGLAETNVAPVNSRRRRTVLAKAIDRRPGVVSASE
jgi:hypothetical protein